MPPINPPLVPRLFVVLEIVLRHAGKRGPSPEPIDLRPPGWQPPWGDSAKGPLVAPGRYTATLMLGIRALGKPQSFEVKPVNNLPEGTDPAAVAAFQQEAAELRRRSAAESREIAQARDDVRHMRAALVTTPKADPALLRRVDDLDKKLAELSRRLDGDPVRGRLNESAAPSISNRVFSAMSSWETRQLPTATQRRDVEVAGAELGTLTKELDALVAGELKALGAALDAAGAPWTPRRR